MKRAPGYYWIIWADEWEVALYRSDGVWLLTGFEEEFTEDRLTEIDERRILKD